MRIEKLSNNKLKVIFSIKELEKENIDYQAFMSGSSKCENLLSSLLYIAKDELDFDTQNCNVEIETFEINHGDFVLTITKFEKSHAKVKTHRKQGNLNGTSCIYEFSNLDNYYDFDIFLRTNFSNLYYKFKNNSEVIKISKKILLVIDGANFSEDDSCVFNSSITEFANFKSNSKALISKIKENL